jgi:hypothetical protein
MRSVTHVCDGLTWWRFCRFLDFRMCSFSQDAARCSMVTWAMKGSAIRRVLSIVETVHLFCPTAFLSLYDLSGGCHTIDTSVVDACDVVFTQRLRTPLHVLTMRRIAMVALISASILF